MLPYLSKKQAVKDMHQRGYTNDFHLFGNDLLWVQEQRFIRMGDFAIVEYHRFLHPRSKKTETIVFGVFSHHHHVKGILINDYAGYSKRTPPVIVKKMNELNAKTLPAFNS